MLRELPEGGGVGVREQRVEWRHSALASKDLIVLAPELLLSSPGMEDEWVMEVNQSLTMWRHSWIRQTASLSSKSMSTSTKYARVSSLLYGLTNYSCSSLALSVVLADRGRFSFGSLGTLNHVITPFLHLYLLSRGPCKLLAAY